MASSSIVLRWIGELPVSTSALSESRERGHDMSATNITDLLLRTGLDDAVAVVDTLGPHTYAELRAAVATASAELIRLGLQPGARVAIIGPNSFFWVASYLAAMRIGTAVPLSEKLTEQELGAQLSWAGCAAVLADRRSLRRLGSLASGLLSVTDGQLSGVVRGLPESAHSAVDAVLMFTSGTTSRPKAVRVTHANLVANTASIIEFLELSQSDRMLVILPFHYCFGASLLHTHLAVGGAVVLCNTFAFPETALDLIESEACTGFAGVPSTFQLLARASTFTSRALPTLRIVQQAGGRLSPTAVSELAAAHPASSLYVMYGQTEATARLSYLPPNRIADKAGSIGKGIPGVDLAVLDESGRQVQPGQRGEIVARGANISPGYYRDPHETARKFQDGALHTGDLATVDDEGFIFIVGRSEDFIKSWGHRIAPQQIEEVALTHPSVAEAAVVGVPDPQAGERIVLVVVLKDDEADSQELLSFLANRLAKHATPHAVVTFDELPLNANGKVSRVDLQARLGHQLSGSAATADSP